ncbi:hypothetical protein [Leptotrichia wadei]|uniref:hypothetical protein n=1 Tax=Leptotrichia wadei TaxID=157687 RepID=UPI0028D04028|nr:hypothetical protein [Leptotrichia wadei]
MYPFSKSYIEKDIKKEIDNDDYDEIARNYNLDKIKTYGLFSIYKKWGVTVDKKNIPFKFNLDKLKQFPWLKESERKSKEIEKKAILGIDLSKETLVKLSYKKEDDKKYSNNTQMKKEYVENEYIEDQTPYNKLSFINIKNFINLLEISSNRNSYGDRLVILLPILTETYYLMDDDFEYKGDKLFVKKVLELKNFDTWLYLEKEIGNFIIPNKEKIIEYLRYLKEINETSDFNDVIKEIEEYN